MSRPLVLPAARSAESLFPHLGHEKRLYFQGDARVPNLPSIIVVPDAVFHQWCGEFRRFLDATSVTLTAIKSPDDDHRSKTLVAAMANKSTLGAKLFIVSLNSVKKDFKLKYTTRGKPDAEGIFPAQKVATRFKTLYDYDWNVVWMDEIHEIRNPGDKYNAMLALFRKGKFTGGMSATPLTTKLEDIPMIGRAVGFGCFTGAAGANYIAKLRGEMVKHRSQAAAERGRLFMSTQDPVGNLDDAIQAGIEETPDFKSFHDSNVMGVMKARLKSMLRLVRPHFVRRHKRSVTPTGDVLLALPDYQIIRVPLDLAAHEKDLLTLEVEKINMYIKNASAISGDPYVRIFRPTPMNATDLQS